MVRRSDSSSSWSSLWPSRVSRPSGMSRMWEACTSLNSNGAACKASRAAARHEFGEHGGVNMSVEASTTFTVMDPETITVSPGTTRRKLANVFNTNQIYELDYRDVKIYNKAGKRYIDARYEVRLPVLWRLDMVLKFDDLHYQVGDQRPVLDMPGEKKK